VDIPGGKDSLMGEEYSVEVAAQRYIQVLLCLAAWSQANASIQIEKPTQDGSENYPDGAAHGSKDPGSRVKSGIQEAARTKTIKNACAHAITTMHSTVETAQQISSLSQYIQVREGIKAGTLHVQMAIKSSPSW
jgi:hypothetical protein